MKAPPLRDTTASFLDLDFDLLDETSSAGAVLSLAQSETFTYVVTPNVDHLVRLHGRKDDVRLWSAYQNAALCLCDSRILRALAHLSGITLDLVTGSDLTARLLNSGGVRSAAIIGGDERLLRDLCARYSHIRFFHHAAPHGLLNNPQAQLDVVHFVENCSAGAAFFAVGSPQSEYICALIAKRGNATGVGLCIGASLEFLTGAKRRAPGWMQRSGLEWLYRLASEPVRLWRRYLVEGPAIFWIWWRWRVSSSR